MLAGGDKPDDPLNAGVAAGIEAGQAVLKKAKKDAAKAAKHAAEEAVKEALQVTELPTGDGKGTRTKYIEEVNLTAAVEGMKLGIKPSMIHGLSATGKIVLKINLSRG